MTPEQETIIREALEQMVLAKLADKPEDARDIIKGVRDKLAVHLGVSPEEQKFLQAHQQWLNSSPDMNTNIWEDFEMSESGFSTLTLQVDKIIEDEQTLTAMAAEEDAVKRAWVMGYFIGMLGERRTQAILKQENPDA